MKTTLLQILFIAALMLAIIPAVNAFQSTLTLQGGTAYGISDMELNRTLYGAFGLSYEAWLSQNLALGLNPYVSRTQSADATNSFKSDNYGADLYLKLRPTKFMALNFPDKAVINRISPFIAAGVGFALYDSKGGTDEDNNPGTPSVAFENDGFVAVLPHAAAGISFLTKWNVNLDLGIKLNYTTTDEIDNKIAGDWKDGSYTPYIGIGFNFGGKKTPVILTSGNLNKFSAVKGTASAAQSYSLSGTDIREDIVITAPEGYEISTNGGTTWVKIANVDRDFAGTIRVRMTGVQTGEFKGNVVHSSKGAANVNLPVSGTVIEYVPKPEIRITGTLGNFATDKGIPSATQSYTITGTDLTNQIEITAPAGYEISVDGGTTWVKSAKVDPDFYGVVRARLIGAQSGSYDGNIVHSSSGAPNANVAVKGVVSETIAEIDIKLIQTVVHFDTNYYVLSAPDKLKLDALAAGLKQFPDVKLLVQGHTDNTGNDAINTPLGENRAKVVKEYLVGKGVNGSRLDVKGFGPTKPVDTNETVEGRAHNRRTDFIIK
ncbi:MAG: OmpA family protein [Candidatus Syntrophosphaera sp.]|nr:OmpA family protein [Candidatus Syntrophosphaera sp.]